MTRARDIADQQDNLGGAVAPFVAGKNAIINGGFDIWQRGTSIANSSFGYTADRFRIQSYNAMTVSQQLTGDTTNLPNITYAARVQRDSGATGVNFVYFTQSIESLNSRQFAGKTITFSFYARRGANFSGASNVIGGEVLSGTGTDQSVLGYTGSTNVTSTSATLTTTWQRFTFTGTVPATSNELGFYIGYTPVGTAGANDWFEITGIQLELGSAATPFARAGGSIGGELALCQRYFQRYSNSMPGRMSSIDVANRPEWNISYSTKRVAPTISVTSATNITWVGMTVASAIASTAFLGTYSGTTVDEGLCFFSTASGISAYTIWAPEFGGAVYIDISAEL